MEYKNYMDSIDKSSSYGYRQEPSIEMSSGKNKTPTIPILTPSFLVVSKNNFIFHYVVGKGGFGKVSVSWLSSSNHGSLGLESRKQEE